MREESWFICYRGSGTFNIVPARAAGWIAIGAFVALVAGAGAALPLVLGRGHDTIWVAGYVLFALAATLLFIRAALAHAEVIDTDEIRAKPRPRRGRDGRR